MIHPPVILFFATLLISSAAIAQEQSSSKRGKGKRQDHRLRLDGIEHRRTAHEAFNEKNGCSGIWRASATKAMDSSAHRSSRRQESLRCHDQQSGATTVLHQGRYLRQYNSPAAAFFAKMSSMPISASPIAIRPSVFSTTKA